MSVRKWILHISFFSATAVLGGVIGLFMGYGPPEAGLLAAILPVLLTSVGWAIFFIYKSQKQDISIVANFSAIGFLISLVCFAYIGYNAYIAYKTSPERSEFLLVCSYMEEGTNRFRKDIGLAPLKSEVFCR